MAVSRIIMMGTGPFAVPTFEMLTASDWEVCVLVTRPVPPPRRRSKVPTNPMREAALAGGINCLEPVDVNDPTVVKQLASLRPDLLVVCDYGQILSAETLSVAPLGGINLHGSLLPKYRGAAPVNWAIYRGDEVTGVTIIHMTPRLDAGPILVQRRTSILPHENAPELETRLAALGVEAVREAIERLAAWDGQTQTGTPQQSGEATRAPRLKKDDAQINFARSAHEIMNQVRAFKPWPGTFAHLSTSGGPLRLIVDQVAIVDPAAEEPPIATAPPGTIVRAEQGILWVSTGDGVLALEKVQPPGKRVMTSAEFLNGHPLATGDQFEPI